MTTTAARMLESRAAILELALTIEAPTEHVWKAMIEESDAWWDADLRCVAAASKLSLDPHAGGRLIEANADGGSLLWFTVVAVEAGVSLYLVGHVAPPFGGPYTTCLFLRLESLGSRTVLHITNSRFGVVDEAPLASVETGWLMLFWDGLKAHVERATSAA
ncbi:MAG: hypothetical protein ACI8QZ_004270 [Chlamydiales bacterium]|jgi:uncharacterized protein YndB with AHSA1/START domain